MEVKRQITNLLIDLKKGLYEKEEVIALSLLSAIAGESIFLLGPPGVAKSLIARRIKYAFADINGIKPNAFEYLMNRFSTPDEIFGPVSISKLKDHDKYERLTDKYLPNATVVFLDEIWKAGPSIQNALLTVLNEKVYRNGEQEIKNLPIKAIISASNELPMKGEGLEALWDRFLIRYIVDGVNDKDNFNEMILKDIDSSEDNINEKYKISNESYYNWNEIINKIDVPENVLNIIHAIRIFIQEYNNKEGNEENQIYISDRRWKKVIRLLRTSAFLNDRLSVDLMDCFLIANCIWNDPKQIQIVRDLTKAAIIKKGHLFSSTLIDIKRELEIINEDVIEELNIKNRISINEPILIEDKYYKIIDNFPESGNINSIVPQTERRGQISFNVFTLPIKQAGPEFNLILKSDYEKLTNTYYGFNIYASNKDLKTFSLKKGLEINSIINNDITYKLLTNDKIGAEEFKIIPEKKIVIEWNYKLHIVRSTITNIKNVLNQYKENDLKQLRENLFVNPDLANIIEINLKEIQLELEKSELEADRIQHYFENQ